MRGERYFMKMIEIQRELNKRMSKIIHTLKGMTEFKEHMHTCDSDMGFLERIIMIIMARSIFVKRVSVIEDIEHPPTKSNLKECFRRALDAERIIKYKQSEKWFGTWIVWYVE